MEQKIYPIPQRIVYQTGISIYGAFTLGAVHVSITAGANKATHDRIRAVMTEAGITDVTYSTGLQEPVGRNHIILGIAGDDEAFTTCFNSMGFADTGALAPASDNFDAYVLGTCGNDIIIMGRDGAGLFCGLATLRLMMLHVPEIPRVPKIPHVPKIQHVLINDYADTQVRGVVEGFYGIPWPHEIRLNMIKMMGNFKMNSFVYAPKDDPYHFGPKWADPYPADMLAELKELAAVAKANGVSFVWTTHVSEHMDFFDADDAFNATRHELEARQWLERDRATGRADTSDPRDAGDLDFPIAKGQHNIDSYSEEESYAKLFAKFEQLYSIGVRQFGFLIDDINFPQARFNIPFHVLAANKIAAWGKAKGDVAPLIVCPAYYHQQDIAYNGRIYMRTIKGDPYADPLVVVPATASNPEWEGEAVTVTQPGLDADIQVMYTGRHVMADVNGDDYRWWINGNSTIEGTPGPDGDSNGYGQAGMRRLPLIWWNYPVTDYDGNVNRILMGPTPVTRDDSGAVTAQALCKNAKGTMCGVLANPMQQGHLSEIALFGLGDYAWNIDAFNPMQSWEDSFQYLYSEVAKSMFIFAQHNMRRNRGDEHMLNHNGESFALKKCIDAFESALNETPREHFYIAKARQNLAKEISTLADAASHIKGRGSYLLRHDILPWVNKTLSLCRVLDAADNFFGAWMSHERDKETIQPYLDAMQAEKASWPNITVPLINGKTVEAEVGLVHLKPFVDSVIARVEALVNSV